MKTLLDYLASLTRGMRLRSQRGSRKLRNTIPGQAPVRMDGQAVLSARGAAHIEPIEDEA
jgi:hypothetical protein